VAIEGAWRQAPNSTPSDMNYIGEGCHAVEHKSSLDIKSRERYASARRDAFSMIGTQMAEARPRLGQEQKEAPLSAIFGNGSIVGQPID